MTNLLKTGSDWLEEQRKNHCSTAVTYSRGEDSAEVAATIGRTEFEVAGDYGVIERTESRDFLILATDLVLAGVAAAPQRGDQIRETVGEKVYVYEVMAPGVEPCWRYSDSHRKTLRVHTKHVETNTA